MSSSVITKIEKKEYYDEFIVWDPSTYYDGYGITFDNNNDKYIKFKICNGQKCCERWKIWSKSDDNLQEFIGAEIKNIQYTTIINDALNCIRSDYDVITLKLTIETNKGELILMMYNSHNGYYSHECIIDYNLTIDNKETKYYKSFDI
jgi:hypothetical protein